MKVKIEFDSENPDDMADLKIYYQAKELYSALYDVKDMVFRIIDGHEHVGRNNTIPTMQELSQLINDMIYEYNIDWE